MFYNLQSDEVLYGDNLLPNGGLHSDQEYQIESLERRLKQQQIQSEQDSRWLAEEETNLVSIHAQKHVQSDTVL